MKLLKRFIFFGSLSFIFLIIVYLIFFFNYEKFVKIKNILQNKPIIGTFYNLSFNTLVYVENELDFSRVLFKLKEKEPNNLNLNISAADYGNIMSQIEFFKEKGFIKDEFNYWRKAKLDNNKDRYNIKYKLHGTSISPLKENFFNLRIKFNKDENYLNNERQFNLIRLYKNSDENISTIIINNLANNIGLLSPRGETVLLKINNVNHGLFYKQSRHDKEWFEKQKITNYTLLKNNDDWDKKIWGHTSDLDLHEHNIELSGSSINPEIALGSLKILFESIKSENIENILSKIDVDYFAKFMALLSIINDPHMITGDNLKFIYDHTIGTFKVLFRHESEIDYQITTNVADFNKSLFIGNNSETLKLFKILLKNNNFRKQRDIYIKEILDKKLEIIDYANKFYDESHKNIMFSNLPLSDQKYLKKIFFQNLNHNFKKTSEYLNYAKIYSSKERKNDDTIQLSIINDSFMPVRLRSIHFIKPNTVNETIKINYEYEEKYILPAINLKKNLIDHNEKKILIFSELEISKIEFENLITKKKINNEHIYINEISNYKISKNKTLINSLKLNKINFDFKNKNLFIKKGQYEIIKDIIVPIGINTNIEKGTKFYMAKNTSFLFQGDLTAKGSKEENILIKVLKDNEPFGTFAIVGKNFKAKVNLSNFIIEGGSEAKLEGITFLGQLSIHNSDVSIQDSKIMKSFSDDGANIRNSNIDILNTSFSYNKFDQLDLDFCNGNLINNEFVNLSNELNEGNGGDGIDLSGSNVLISNNQVQNLSDKGISVGEKSQALIFENEFTKNNIAIAIKDESKIYNINNNYVDNNLNFSMYVKKKFFKEPILFLDENKKFDKIIPKKYDIKSGKIIFIEKSNQPNFYNEFKNEITSSRI